MKPDMSANEPSGKFGNHLLPERDLRNAKKVEDVEVYGVPDGVVRAGGISVVENPSRESMYTPSNDNKRGAVRPWKPRGRA